MKRQHKIFVEEIRLLCAKGGFNLTKFMATDPKVLEKLPIENLVKKFRKKLEFENKVPETPTPERALGVELIIENDLLGFRIK